METKKICCGCDDEKSLDQFSFRNKAKNTYQSNCDECLKTIRKESYQRHKQTTLDRNKKNIKRNVKWFKEYKSTLKCSHCPENHIACIDFHHVDSDNKEHLISKMIYECYSIKKIKEEIDKCIPLCANCHRKVHYYSK